jgi:trk system potassium uptake protein TrkA
MFIIIAGGGRVGYHLMKSQINKKNEVVVIEKNREKCQCITEEMGSLVLHGDACDPKILENAGIARAEMIVACTDKDQDNLIICQLARKKFRVPYTIALVNDPPNEEVFRKLGVDAAVGAIHAVLNRIDLKIAQQGVMTVLARESGVEIIETRISADSPAVGKSLGQLDIPDGSIIPAVIRGGRLVSCTPETFIKPEDIVISISPETHFSGLKKVFLGTEIALGSP